MIYKLEENETINEALKKVKPFDIIYLRDKIYNEKVKITIPNVKLIGNNNTSIENQDYYNKIHSDNKEYLTVRTYTLMVQADNVELENITVKNLSVPNSIYGQAVALHVIGDNFRAINCKFYGAQDTILSGPIPYDLTLRYKDLLPSDELSQKKSHQHFYNCYIEGDVDFIFGCGVALFENCTIHSIGKGYISAPSHPRDYEFGFVFMNCNLTSVENNENQVYLARPWREYGASCFINCNASSHIKPEGFHFWNKEREKTCKMYIYNTIPYENLAGFVKVIKDDELKNYSIDNILKS